ncbi:nitrogen fixation protein NifR [Staphylococcus aureus]|nr:nitrogen fixation protein NifR [Staphylococcus aureus]
MSFFNTSPWPQHREIGNEILQAMRVGVGRRNKFCENIFSVSLP